MHFFFLLKDLCPVILKFMRHLSFRGCKAGLQTSSTFYLKTTLVLGSDPFPFFAFSLKKEGIAWMDQPDKDQERL